MRFVGKAHAGCEQACRAVSGDLSRICLADHDGAALHRLIQRQAVADARQPQVAEPELARERDIADPLRADAGRNHAQQHARERHHINARTGPHDVEAIWSHSHRVGTEGEASFPDRRAVDGNPDRAAIMRLF